jgi:hypothetical protein
MPYNAICSHAISACVSNMFGIGKPVVIQKILNNIGVRESCNGVYESKCFSRWNSLDIAGYEVILSLYMAA